MRFRIRRADQIVGAFILIAIGLVVLLLVFIALNQRWFTHTSRYHSLFSSANSLAVGGGITMRGFEIGKISKISLTDNDMVDLEFIVYQEFTNRVTKNSLLELSTSPIGLGTALLFHRGKAKELLAEGSMIPSLDSPEGKEIDNAGLADIPKKDDTIARLLSGVNDLLENLNQTVLMLNGSVKGKGPVIDLLGNAKDAIVGISAILSGVQKNLDPILSGASTMIGTVNNDLPGTMTDLASSMKKIDAMLSGLSNTVNDLQKISSGINGEVPKLSSLLMETRAAISNAQDVMEGLKNNPLLKGGISEKPSQQALFESMRREDFK